MSLKPTRPALRYFGGKWRIGKWIISHFPDHECYVEPFGGGMSVLLQKPRSLLETYNDLYGNVVNFFCVLRNQPDELIRLIELTPWASAEYGLSQEPSDDPLEEARRFYVNCWMGFGGGRACLTRQGWRYQVRYGDVWKPSSISFMETGHLYQVAQRLRGVQIDNRSASKVIKVYDAPTTLFYLDPPYVYATRSKRKHTYAIEMDDGDHEELAELLHGIQGMALISGYPSGLYQLLYERHGWKRVKIEARSGGTSNTERVEALWLSPRTLAALERRDLPLFNLESHHLTSSLL